jgi:hypothetical protein
MSGDLVKAADEIMVLAFLRKRLDALKAAA